MLLKINNFLRNECGATAVEFAIMANVFFLLSMGILEFGFINYMKVAVQSVALNVSRFASIQNPYVYGCEDTACAVTQYVNNATKAFVYNSSGKYVHVDVKVLNPQGDSSPPPKPDVCLYNLSDPYPDSCQDDFYIDNNSNGKYDKPGSLTSTMLGQPGDLVEIRITYVWRSLFPMMNQFFQTGKKMSSTGGGDKGEVTISSTAVFRNEPIAK